MVAAVFVPDELVTAAKMNTLPKGILGYAQATAAQNGINAEVDLTGLSVAVTLQASRRIRVHFQGIFGQTGGAGAPSFRIYEDATVKQRFVLSMPTGEFAVANVTAILTPTAGAHTYKVRAAAGGGPINFIPGATEPGFILVEDIGAV